MENSMFPPRAEMSMTHKPALMPVENFLPSALDQTNGENRESDLHLSK